MFVKFSSLVCYLPANARFGSSLPQFGCTCVGSSCSVLDRVHSELELLFWIAFRLRSRLRSRSFSSSSGSSGRHESLSCPIGTSCLGSLTLALHPVRLEQSSLLRSFACFGSSLPLLGRSRVEFSCSVLDGI